MLLLYLQELSKDAIDKFFAILNNFRIPLGCFGNGIPIQFTCEVKAAPQVPTEPQDVKCHLNRWSTRIHIMHLRNDARTHRGCIAAEMMRASDFPSSESFQKSWPPRTAHRDEVKHSQLAYLPKFRNFSGVRATYFGSPCFVL